MRTVNFVSQFLEFCTLWRINYPLGETFDLLSQSIDERKLSGMERDLAAVQAKLDAMEEVSEKIATSHPRGC